MGNLFLLMVFICSLLTPGDKGTRSEEATRNFVDRSFSIILCREDCIGYLILPMLRGAYAAVYTIVM
jgi:hypothetical protein